MTTQNLSAVLSVLVLAGALAQSSPAQSEEATARGRIGVYDSRSVAVAFAGSALHQKELQNLKDRYQKAKEANDRTLMAKLEAEGEANQEMAHQQAFSTASVEDILAHIPDELSKIRKTAGVTALISKWNEAELEKHPGAERIDVTPQMIDAFKPTERQRKSAIEIQKHKPVPLTKFKSHRH